MDKKLVTAKTLPQKQVDAIVGYKDLKYTTENILILAIEGMSNMQIAEKFGVSHQAIQQRLLRLGIKRNEFNVNLVQAFIKKRPEILAFKQKKILDAMTDEKIEKAPLNVLGPALGILIEKEQLVRGLPTQIHDINQTNLTLVQISQQRAALVDKYPWLGAIEAEVVDENSSEDVCKADGGD